LLEIERDLKSIGCPYFVPVETRDIIHHRTKRVMTRRFPLLPGYAFVRAPVPWPALEALPTVAAILGIDGQPIPIMQSDLDALVTAQENADDRLDHERQRRKEAARKLTRSRANGIYPEGSSVTITHDLMGKVPARVTGATGRKTLKVVAEFLGGMVPVEVPIDSVEMAA
jgi:transcription antitermination factor NusG